MSFLSNAQKTAYFDDSGLRGEPALPLKITPPLLQPYLRAAMFGGITGAGFGAIGAPKGKGVLHEGMGRGLIRGASTGLGAELGARLGSLAADKIGTNSIVPGLLGVGAGGLGGWLLSGKALGGPSWWKDEFKSDKKKDVKTEETVEKSGKEQARPLDKDSKDGPLEKDWATVGSEIIPVGMTGQALIGGLSAPHNYGTEGAGRGLLTGAGFGVGGLLGNRLGLALAGKNSEGWGRIAAGLGGAALGGLGGHLVAESLMDDPNWKKKKPDVSIPETAEKTSDDKKEAPPLEDNEVYDFNDIRKIHPIFQDDPVMRSVRGAGLGTLVGYAFAPRRHKLEGSGYGALRGMTAGAAASAGMAASRGIRNAFGYSNDKPSTGKLVGDMVGGGIGAVAGLVAADKIFGKPRYEMTPEVRRRVYKKTPDDDDMEKTSSLFGTLLALKTLGPSSSYFVMRGMGPVAAANMAKYKGLIGTIPALAVAETIGAKNRKLMAMQRAQSKALSNALSNNEEDEEIDRLVDMHEARENEEALFNSNIRKSRRKSASINKVGRWFDDKDSPIEGIFDESDEDGKKKKQHASERYYKYWHPFRETKKSSVIVLHNTVDKAEPIMNKRSNVGCYPTGGSGLNPAPTGQNKSKSKINITNTTYGPAATEGLKGKTGIASKIAKIEKISAFCAAFIAKAVSDGVNDKDLSAMIVKSAAHSPVLKKEWQKVFAAMEKQAANPIKYIAPTASKVGATASGKRIIAEVLAGTKPSGTGNFHIPGKGIVEMTISKAPDGELSASPTGRVSPDGKSWPKEQPMSGEFKLTASGELLHTPPHKIQLADGTHLEATPVKGPTGAADNLFTVETAHGTVTVELRPDGSIVPTGPQKPGDTLFPIGNGPPDQLVPKNRPDMKPTPPAIDGGPNAPFPAGSPSAPGAPKPPPGAPPVPAGPAAPPAIDGGPNAPFPAGSPSAPGAPKPPPGAPPVPAGPAAPPAVPTTPVSSPVAPATPPAISSPTGTGATRPMPPALPDVTNPVAYTKPQRTREITPDQLKLLLSDTAEGAAARAAEPHGQTYWHPSKPNEVIYFDQVNGKILEKTPGGTANELFIGQTTGPSGKPVSNVIGSRPSVVTDAAGASSPLPINPELFKPNTIWTDVKGYANTGARWAGNATLIRPTAKFIGKHPGGVATAGILGGIGGFGVLGLNQSERHHLNNLRLQGKGQITAEHDALQTLNSTGLLDALMSKDKKAITGALSSADKAHPDLGTYLDQSDRAKMIELAATDPEAAVAFATSRMQLYHGAKRKFEALEKPDTAAWKKLETARMAKEREHELKMQERGNKPTAPGIAPPLDPEAEEEKKKRMLTSGIHNLGTHWGDLDPSHKWMAGLGGAGALAGLAGTLSGDQSMRMWGPLLGIGGLAAGAYGLSGGKPERIFSKDFWSGPPKPSELSGYNTTISDAKAEAKLPPVTPGATPPDKPVALSTEKPLAIPGMAELPKIAGWRKMAATPFGLPGLPRLDKPVNPIMDKPTLQPTPPPPVVADPSMVGSSKDNWIEPDTSDNRYGLGRLHGLAKPQGPINGLSGLGKPGMPQTALQGLGTVKGPPPGPGLLPNALDRTKSLMGGLGTGLAGIGTGNLSSLRSAGKQIGESFTGKTPQPPSTATGKGFEAGPSPPQLDQGAILQAALTFGSGTANNPLGAFMSGHPEVKKQIDTLQQSSLQRGQALTKFNEKVPGSVENVDNAAKKEVLRFAGKQDPSMLERIGIWFSGLDTTQKLMIAGGLLAGVMGMMNSGGGKDGGMNIWGPLLAIGGGAAAAYGSGLIPGFGADKPLPPAPKTEFSPPEQISQSRFTPDVSNSLTKVLSRPNVPMAEASSHLGMLDDATYQNYKKQTVAQHGEYAGQQLEAARSAYPNMKSLMKFDHENTVINGLSDAFKAFKNPNADTAMRKQAWNTVGQMIGGLPDMTPQSSGRAAATLVSNLREINPAASDIFEQNLTALASGDPKAQQTAVQQLNGYLHTLTGNPNSQLSFDQNQMNNLVQGIKPVVDALPHIKKLPPDQQLPAIKSLEQQALAYWNKNAEGVIDQLEQAFGPKEQQRMFTFTQPQQPPAPVGPVQPPITKAPSQPPVQPPLQPPTMPSLNPQQIAGMAGAGAMGAGAMFPQFGPQPQGGPKPNPTLGAAGNSPAAPDWDTLTQSDNTLHPLAFEPAKALLRDPNLDITKAKAIVSKFNPEVKNALAQGLYNETYLSEKDRGGRTAFGGTVNLAPNETALARRNSNILMSALMSGDGVVGPKGLSFVQYDPALPMDRTGKYEEARRQIKTLPLDKVLAGDQQATALFSNYAQEPFYRPHLDQALEHYIEGDKADISSPLTQNAIELREALRGGRSIIKPNANQLGFSMTHTDDKVPRTNQAQYYHPAIKSVIDKMQKGEAGITDYNNVMARLGEVGYNRYGLPVSPDAFNEFERALSATKYKHPKLGDVEGHGISPLAYWEYLQHNAPKSFVERAIDGVRPENQKELADWMASRLDYPYRRRVNRRDYDTQPFSHESFTVPNLPYLTEKDRSRIERIDQMNEMVNRLHNEPGKERPLLGRGTEDIANMVSGKYEPSGFFLTPDTLAGQVNANRNHLLQLAVAMQTGGKVNPSSRVNYTDADGNPTSVKSLDDAKNMWATTQAQLNDKIDELTNYQVERYIQANGLDMKNPDDVREAKVALGDVRKKLHAYFADKLAPAGRREIPLMH